VAETDVDSPDLLVSMLKSYVHLSQQRSPSLTPELQLLPRSITLTDLEKFRPYALSFLESHHGRARR
jgi:hypothetical protein